MTNTLVGWTVAALLGAIIGGTVVSDHYVRKQVKQELLQHEAQKERNAAIGRLSAEYYERYKMVGDRPTGDVPERVYVKADCPVRAAEPAGMDDGTSTGRVELAADIVRDLAAIAHAADVRYEQCAIQLSALQSVVRSQ